MRRPVPYPEDEVHERMELWPFRAVSSIIRVGATGSVETILCLYVGRPTCAMQVDPAKCGTAATIIDNKLSIFWR
jgi:hypothetical protein